MEDILQNKCYAAIGDRGWDEKRARIGIPPLQHYSRPAILKVN